VLSDSWLLVVFGSEQWLGLHWNMQIDWWLAAGEHHPFGSLTSGAESGQSVARV
jgi:hypothetical protein